MAVRRGAAARYRLVTQVHQWPVARQPGTTRVQELSEVEAQATSMRGAQRRSTDVQRSQYLARLGYPHRSRGQRPRIERA